MGITSDVGRAAGISLIAGGGLQGAVGRGGTTTTATGFHATNPGNVQSIMANGLWESSSGRLGGGGVYVNNTSAGAIAEFAARNPGVTPSVLQVQYTPGLNYRISPPPGGYTTGPLPLAADTLTTGSLRLPGTFNTIIRNGTATPLPPIP